MNKRDAHRFRRGEPDFTMLVRGDNGQITHNVSFRKGGPAQAYIDLREWCYNNGINFSDIINSIIEPLFHFCCNFARRDKQDNIIITLNFGDICLEQVYHARTPERKAYAKDTHKAKYADNRARRVRLI